MAPGRAKASAIIDSAPQMLGSPPTYSSNPTVVIQFTPYLDCGAHRPAHTRLRAVDGQGLIRDCVPGKSRFGGEASVLSHPSRPFEVGEQRPQPPTDRVGVGMDFETVHVVPYELLRATVDGGDNRLAGAPCFQDNDAERLVPARNADHVTGLVEVA